MCTYEIEKLVDEAHAIFNATSVYEIRVYALKGVLPWQFRMGDH